MTAPAMPRPSLDSLRADLARADAAYTLAVQHAARDHDWGHAQTAAQAVHQARNALAIAEGGGGMSGRTIGQQEDCVQCGESKAAVKESQRKGGQHQLYCATVDYFGECDADWERHKFTWTKKDQAAQEARDAHWDAMAREIEEREAAS